MIRFDRLETLATFLDTLPREKFNYESYWCGTRGCAIGWCPTLFPKDWIMFNGHTPRLITLKGNTLDGAMEFFGITINQAGHLFQPWIQSPSVFGGNSLEGSASPSEVAHNIREFIRVMQPEKPKREKIKVQISPDLIEHPIPKEVECIDHFTPEEIKSKAEDFVSEWAEKIEAIPCTGPDEVIPLEEAAKDFQNSLNDYSKALNSTIDFLMESAYQGYKKARTGNHFLTPEFFSGIYKREDIEKFEARLKMEKSI